MTTVDGTPGFGANVLDWLHEGYPEGVPPKDYFPLLALLLRSLTEEQVRDAIRQVIDKEPNPEEINQVAGRLASVGWPLENNRR